MIKRKIKEKKKGLKVEQPLLFHHTNFTDSSIFKQIVKYLNTNNTRPDDP